MDFTRLNLKAYLTEGNSTPGSNLATAAEDKTSEAATNVSAPKQVDPARKEMQMKQRTAKFGTPTTNQSMMSNSFDPMLTLRTGKELIKMREAAKCDWRKELMEAANPDDDPNHPYVEVMPQYQYRVKEFMQNLQKGRMKDKAQGDKTPALSGVNEGYVKRSERDHDKMNDQAHKHDKAYRKKLNPNASEEDLIGGTDFSDKGEIITREVAKARHNPIEYKHEKKRQEIENRRRGKNAIANK